MRHEHVATRDDIRSIQVFQLMGYVLSLDAVVASLYHFDSCHEVILTRNC